VLAIASTRCVKGSTRSDGAGASRTTEGDDSISSPEPPGSRPRRQQRAPNAGPTGYPQTAPGNRGPPRPRPRLCVWPEAVRCQAVRGGAARAPRSTPPPTTTQPLRSCLLRKHRERRPATQTVVEAEVVTPDEHVPASLRPGRSESSSTSMKRPTYSPVTTDPTTPLRTSDCSRLDICPDCPTVDLTGVSANDAPDGRGARPEPPARGQPVHIGSSRPRSHCRRRTALTWNPRAFSGSISLTEREDEDEPAGTSQIGGGVRGCCPAARRWTRSASRRCWRFMTGGGGGTDARVEGCELARPRRAASARRCSRASVR
jgi:hypothetical protein